ncbi:hypothetical protein Q5P01_013664 [Channa striata]|uniref:Uncharacterized protein n=1 Tax=Channa striata TaxID=64152 RepID=A0AA88SKL6_CHASR|nr:hypothetical protein Q5P01_013664 [Channa striata]
MSDSRRQHIHMLVLCLIPVSLSIVATLLCLNEKGPGGSLSWAEEQAEKGEVALGGLIRGHSSVHAIVMVPKLKTTIIAPVRPDKRSERAVLATEGVWESGAPRL